MIVGSVSSVGREIGATFVREGIIIIIQVKHKQSVSGSKCLKDDGGVGVII